MLALMRAAARAWSGPSAGSLGAARPRARAPASIRTDKVNAAQAAQLTSRTAAMNKVPSSRRARAAVIWCQDGR